MTLVMTYLDTTFTLENGDVLYAASTNETITFFYAFDDGETQYVAIKHGTADPELMLVQEFANMLAIGFYQIQPEATYKVGYQFVHLANNHTTRVLGVSPLLSNTLSELVYFCQMINEFGQLEYLTVPEGYIHDCLPVAETNIAAPRPDEIGTDVFTVTIT